MLVTSESLGDLGYLFSIHQLFGTETHRCYGKLFTIIVHKATGHTQGHAQLPLDPSVSLHRAPKFITDFRLGMAEICNSESLNSEPFLCSDLRPSAPFLEELIHR